MKKDFFKELEEALNSLFYDDLEEFTIAFKLTDLNTYLELDVLRNEINGIRKSSKNLQKRIGKIKKESAEWLQNAILALKSNREDLAEKAIFEQMLLEEREHKAYSRIISNFEKKKELVLKFKALKNKYKKNDNKEKEFTVLIEKVLTHFRNDPPIRRSAFVKNKNTQIKKLKKEFKHLMFQDEINIRLSKLKIEL